MCIYITYTGILAVLSFLHKNQTCTSNNKLLRFFDFVIFQFMQKIYIYIYRLELTGCGVNCDPSETGRGERPLKSSSQIWKISAF